MVKKYIVIQRSDLINLQNKVEEHLKTGWKLVGGVSFADGYYLQAMTKRYSGDDNA